MRILLRLLRAEYRSFQPKGHAIHSVILIIRSIHLRESVYIAVPYYIDDLLVLKSLKDSVKFAALVLTKLGKKLGSINI